MSRMRKRAVAIISLAILAAPLFASADTITHTLSIGTRGNEVITLQNFLISQNLLATDSATGYFGDLTRAAVVALQQANGLETVGWVGRLTRALVNDGLTQLSQTAAAGGTTRPHGKPAADTTPPSTPTNLTATAVSSSQINLAWTASTDNKGVTGYKIYRNGVQFATSISTTFQNTANLSPNTTYTYNVAAFDAAGNVSAQSAPASATTNAGSGTGPTCKLTTYNPNVGSGSTISIYFTDTNTNQWSMSNGAHVITGGTYESGWGWVMVTVQTSGSYTMTVTDQYGNTNTCSQTINVTPVSLPSNMTWVTCAPENNFCPFVGTRYFRYDSVSNPSQYIIYPATDGVNCNYQTIGDPDPGVSKVCQFGIPYTPTNTDPTVVNVKDFGAKGDGVTNDSDAFFAASKKIESMGGGTLNVAPGTYVVLHQTFVPGTGYFHVPVIRINTMKNPFSIIGNGAVLRAPNGLHYGTFDVNTGAIYNPPMPYTGPGRGDVGTMIDLAEDASTTISGFELDGNALNYVLGGGWGDVGRQLNAGGISTVDIPNLTITHVYTHHHGEDGLMIANYGLTPTSTPGHTVLDTIDSEYNGRQGFSWVGGIGLTATNCKFNNTGQIGWETPPGAGLDIEAEGSVVRNGTFTNCEFSNNASEGIVADSGDSANITFDNITVWGTHNWSMWLNKPYITIKNSAIHGPFVHPWGLAAAGATVIASSTIDDYNSPVYGPTQHNYYFMDFGAGGTDYVQFLNDNIHVKYSKGLYGNAIFRNTNWYHENGYLPYNDYTDVVGPGTVLDNVHFKENFSPTPTSTPPQWWIDGPGGGIIVGPGPSYIDGPYVVGFINGFGTIPPGNNY